MNKVFGNSKRKRVISFFLLISFVSEIITPTATLALTGGPSQPEVQAFTPVNTSEMVDLTSGDFKYNIPLMDVGGYPLNIAYNSGIGMDQEASWVGLGWNLNVGAINRNMRGLPDDFNGEEIVKEFNMKDNNTFGVNVGVGVELFGWSKPKSSTSSGSSGSLNLNIGLGLTYNNYTGIGMEHSANVGISAGNSGKGSMNAGLGIKASNSGGLTVSPSVSFSYKTDQQQKGDTRTSGSAAIGLGMSVNSRGGLKDLNINASYTRSFEQTKKVKNEDGIEENVRVGKASEIGSTSSSAVINFGASTYVPQIQNNMVNNSVALSFKLGTTIFGLDGDVTLSGYFSNQSLMSTNSAVPAYGYMYSHNGQNSDNVLMDFNREKDQSFSRYTKNLPITNQTYDVFSVTGQGIGGAFRPFRSDVGYVFDNSATTTSDSYSGGVEFAAANTAHLGVTLSVVDVNTTTGKWSNDNDAKDKLSAKSGVTTRLDYEPFYFKEVGEKSDNNIVSTLYDDLGKDVPYRVKINGSVNHKATNEIEESGNTTKSIPSVNYIGERQKRNQVLSSLTVNEAKLYGFDKRIYNGTHPKGMNLSTNAHANHIAEITALKVDGTRYIYGLPAYNNSQEEVTFNASQYTTTGNSATQNTYYQGNTGYVSYNTNDITTSNSKGIDHYYNKVKTPGYAHSYLLTAIVSPDYVDLKNDGLTDDDFGNYTKFEYTKVENYNWRMPYDRFKANFNEAGKSIENDDQGNFVYGEKDLWFTTKIETKNYIAIFNLEDRNDAQGVSDINGSNPHTNVAEKNKLIKSISLYSKPEYNADLTPNKTNAVPIKVVHFTYDYSLCKDVPNNVSSNAAINGKLTLKEIYFTYGKSDKAKFSKYVFEYNQGLASNPTLLNNFNYNGKAYDRWGNYMPLNNDATYSSSAVTTYSYNTPLNNAEYPYVDQFSKEHADFRASAWHLTKIKLPSGGEINVNYESDDYAFVQNRPAMQMMKILSITNTTTLNTLPTNETENLYSSPIANNIAINPDDGNNLYLHFELTDNTTTAAQLRERYLKDINANGKFLYFRVLVNLTNTNQVPLQNTGNHFEYVSGYAELDAVPECGVNTNVTGPNNFHTGYVKLKAVVMDDKTSAGSFTAINPIAKAAMNFGKAHYNNIVWDASFSPPADVITAVKQLAGAATSGFAKQMMQAIAGPNNSLQLKDYCNQVVLGKSWIRLYNPNGHKFGGGSRVKNLTLFDNWGLQTTDGLNPNGQDDSEYGQEFTYETEFDGQVISSGVASYEPMLGGDENPFRQPVYMGPNKWNILTPDERFFMEEPFGETFFPSASIVYSKVKVKNKIPQGVNNLKTHGTGYVVHEFYTAKDYPTITKHTPIYSKQYKPALGGLLKIMARDYVSATQGYVIKLNDMHGKAKAQSVYSEGTTAPISKVEYFYKTKGANGYTNYGLKNIYSDASCVPNELDNSCVVIDKNGGIRETTIGMDFDAVADFRENETTTIMGGAQINLSMFLAGVFPGIVPTIWPDFSYEKSRFRSAVLTKVVSNYGILERTTAQDLGSKVTTSNLAYDSQTGDVLVTKTKNDFEDDIYSVKYPAFWKYDLMGPAYKNIGFSVPLTFNTTPGIGTRTSTTYTVSDYFNVGDEVAIGNTTNIGWICDVTVSSITVMDKNGDYINNTGTLDIKVLRSGRRNLLGSQMASLTSLGNPIDLNNDGILDSQLSVTTNHKVLNTSAVEYSDQWQTFKGYEYVSDPGCSCSLTQAAVDWVDFLNALINRNDLLGHVSLASGCPNPPFATVNYPQWANTSLSSIWYTANCTPRWSTNLSPATTYTTTGLQPNVLYGGPNNTVNFDNWYNNGEGCHIKLTLPTELRWSEFVLSQNAYFTFDALPGNCNNNKQVRLNLYNNGEIIPVVLYTHCFELTNCTPSSGTATKCGVDIGDKVNPFVYGIRGNWRTKTSWSFLEERYQTPATTNNNLNIRKDGYMINYSPFYTFTSATWSITPTNWTYTSEISKHTPNGVEVENRDALGRYSSALYGYNESLPIAVASNAQLQEIGYDGFEDYAFGNLTCDLFTKEHHFDFYKHKINLDKLNAHTGKYSMKVLPNSNLTISRKLTSSASLSPQTTACNYTLVGADFIYPFSPITYNGTKKYVLSYWVKERDLNNTYSNKLDYTNSDVSLSLSGGTGSIILGAFKKSNVIDGWQRYEQEFTISAGATGQINCSLNNYDASNTIISYFDDIRIHPFNSNLKSFVYNSSTLKYMAELDANNFATFYEYDEEGSLVRVKKETERGIMTIQETKNHTKR